MILLCNFNNCRRADIVCETGAAARPGKVVGSVLRYGSGLNSAAEVYDQRRVVRNPAVPLQYTSSSCSYPRRNPSCKNQRGDEDGIEGSSIAQPKPCIAREVTAAANGGTGGNW